MAKYDIIIIGGGISGLSLAHYCAKAQLKTLVIEKNDQAGGALHSHGYDSGEQGFWIELGAHTCYNSYSNLIGIIEDDGLLDGLQPREKAPFKILIGNDMKSIPSQLNLPAMLPAPIRMFTLKKEGADLRTYYSKLAGRQNYDKVLKHAFEAVVSQPADDFPAELLFKKRKRRKDVLKKFTFANGMQTIVNTIASEKNIELLTGRTVRSLDINKDKVSITTDEGVYEANYLALATPASNAAILLTDAFPELAAELMSIKVVKTESMGVIVEKQATEVDPFSNLIATDDIFYSVVSRDVVPDPGHRGFTFHFKPGAAAYEQKVGRINEILKLKANVIKEVVEKDNFLPALRVGHENLVAKIDALLENQNLFLAGNYFYGMAIEECVTRSLDQFNQLSKSF